MSRSEVIAAYKHYQQTIKQSVATIEYISLILENQGLYFGVCKINAAHLKLENADIYYTLANQLSELIRISPDLELITALDVTLSKKQITMDIRPSFEMSAFHVLQTLNDLLRIIYDRFLQLKDESVAEAVLRFSKLTRIDSKIRRLVFNPFFKEVDAVGNNELQQVLQTPTA